MPAPGVARTRSVTSSENGASDAFCTTKSAPSVRSICRATEAAADAPATDRPATSASPIIRAAAVAPVRRGLRSALRRLSRPTTPNAGSRPRPSRRITGRTSSGPAITPATSVSTTPSASSDPATAVRSLSTQPASAASPAAPTSDPAAARRRNGRPEPVSSRSARAAIGETRLARSAGSSAATKVTPTPTTYATTTVGQFSTRSAASSRSPNQPIATTSSTASPTPAASPAVAPATPSSNASSSTERRTWRRSAPSARSRPSSRVRCAISIEKVLTIRKTPTRTATPAKPTIMYFSTLRKSPNCSACVFFCSARVRMSYAVPPAPSAAPIRRSTTRSGTPGAASTETPVAQPVLPSRPRWAARVSRKTREEPGLVVVKAAMPTTRTGKVPGGAMTCSVSPIRTPARSAVSRSTIASPGPRGGRPSVTRTGLRSPGVQLVATDGAFRVGPTGVLRASVTVIRSTRTSSRASATPRTPATRSRRAAGTVGVAAEPMPPGASKSCRGVIWTSEAVEAKSRSKVAPVVSEKIRLPTTNATESTTARAESSSRPLCAKKLRSVARSTAGQPFGSGPKPGDGPGGGDGLGPAAKTCIRASTDSAVGRVISSTIRPSAR